MSHRSAWWFRHSTSLLQLIETLALALWIGSMTGFAFLFAPIAFHTIGNLNLFAALIGASIHALLNFGFVLGGIALAATLPQAKTRHTAVLQACIVVMLLATTYEQRCILPAMEQTLHSIGPAMTQMPHDAPLRKTYDALHHQSSAVFGLTLILGFFGLSLCTVKRTHFS